jgi:hypothetical protein
MSPFASRTASRVLAPVLLAIVVLTLVATPSDARIVGQKLPFGLEPVGSPNAVTIDKATGNVYVSDHATRTVRVFGAEGGAPSSGVPSEVTGAETPAGAFSFGVFEEPAGVAIDNSGGPDAEDLYVADTKHRALDKFKLEGGQYKYLCQFKGYGNVGDGCLPNKPTEETSPAQPFGLEGVGGVAVDSHGNVYASDLSAHMVYEFNAAGEDVGETAIPGSEPCGIAVDSNGVVYVQDYVGSVYKLTPNSVTKAFDVALFDTAESFAVAVDPANNQVYVDHKTYVVVREAPEGTEPGKIVGEIRPESEIHSRGVAVSDTTEAIYVSNAVSESVEAFHPVKIPNVKLTGTPTVEPFAATVKGEIEPEGTSEAGYYFEYGEPGTLGLKIPTPVVPVAALSEWLPAEASLEGLEPNTEYGYRLAGTNNSGLVEKSQEEGRFKTLPAKPLVSGSEAIDVTEDGAVLEGEVNPENSLPATYHFQYGVTAAYGSSLPSISVSGAGTTAGLVPVAQSVPASVGLRPDTTYHFSLCAENIADAPGEETCGQDETFTTSPQLETTYPETPPTPGGGPSLGTVAPGAALTAPPGPPLIASTPVAFPNENERGVVPTIKAPQTRAQKLKKALKACKRDRRKRKRISCEKEARKKYGPRAQKKKSE